VKILIAPDKFKGSLSAHEVAENIAEGLREILPDVKIDIVPMADGGEGTAEVICDALGGSWLRCKAHDPLGREIEARYAWIENRKLAVMEMSEAAGLRRLSEDERDPLRANTFGVGEMILGASGRGAREIIIGLGGSATNDGGFGMARALGFHFDYEHEHEHVHHEERPVTDLLGLRGIQTPKSLALPKIVAAVDVRNPLLGENGATRVYGPQKGASPDKIDILERSLTRLADVAEKQFGEDKMPALRDQPGAGAAGGLGFGLIAFCDAKIEPGFQVVAKAIDLESIMKEIDVVITGEGRLDRQTLEGKTPAGVARLARKLGKRVFAIAGDISEDQQAREMFDAVYELGGTIHQAPALLRERARELARSPNFFEGKQRATD
jgi:glycerate kinase